MKRKLFSGRYIYIVITKDTSLITKLDSILCIKKTKRGADKFMHPAREMYQFDFVTQKYAKVLN